jgi:hypothetical protein
MLRGMTTLGSSRSIVLLGELDPSEDVSASESSVIESIRFRQRARVSSPTRRE